jgi:hypothetical protein
MAFMLQVTRHQPETLARILDHGFQNIRSLSERFRCGRACFIARTL